MPLLFAKTTSPITRRYYRRLSGPWLLMVMALVLVGCEGQQSALDPAGHGAERIAELFWWLVGGAVIVWVIVVGLAVYALRVNPGPHPERQTRLLIIGGGALFPTLVLAGYLIYGLSMMPDLLAPAPKGSLEITVSGEQWWWRVQYHTPEGDRVALANEIHLPVGEPVQFHLESPDVAHSFWIPALGGKMDMLPGRTNHLTLHPTRTGVFTGACAEYCGEAHTLMRFYAVVQEKEDFDAWLEQQSNPVASPATPLTQRGEEVFSAHGCGACHAVRGTEADGVIGPDLTHVGSRLSLGAGTLPNETSDFLRWITHTETVKPGVHMPAFGMLPEADLHALAAYLDGLE
ncbi:MAG TPA: cytochrome c oxidase subunit II [Rhodothermales bacterium]|nr:cytochrome c oxidase subunit II [Rhodothermales bacterium]